MTWAAPNTLDAATLTVAAVLVAHRGETTPPSPRQTTPRRSQDSTRTQGDQTMSTRSVITAKQVKARAWPAYGLWRWTCPACHDGGHAWDGNQCHDAARRHVDTWHRNPGMPATTTTMPEYAALDKETDQ